MIQKKQNQDKRLLESELRFEEEHKKVLIGLERLTKYMSLAVFRFFLQTLMEI